MESERKSLVRFDRRVVALVCAGLAVLAGCGSDSPGVSTSPAPDADLEACTEAAHQLGYPEVVLVASFTDVRGLGCSVQLPQGRIVQIEVPKDGSPPVDLGEP